jgi:zinc transporter ZupT
MEAHSRAEELTGAGRRPLPAWLLGLIPLVLIVAALGGFAALGGPGLADRTGPPAEALVVERTVLEPGTIELTVRNDGPDAVRIAQVFVNDGFTDFTVGGDGEVGRLGSERVKVEYPWIEGEAYEVGLLTSTGGTITHEIEVATPTPRSDLSFFGLMALLGIYVGVIPVTLGMLWLPFTRRIGARWMQALMAVTVGLLAFLAVDATLEGLELGGEGAQSLGGTGLVVLGAVLSYIGLTAVGAWMDARREVAVAGAGAAEAGAGATGAPGAAAPLARLSTLVALGIGLHNLGEGLAIGSSYATGALALGAALVVGFAIHNTTEGLAIVAPLARARQAPSLRRLVALGLLAGAPAILGTWIGAAAFNPTIAALLFGMGVGAIAQVIVQIAPSLRDGAGRMLHPVTAGGIAVGMLAIYVTGLLVSV